MRSVALVGPDGAGKSAVARALVEALPVPARRLYMGVNLEASTVMLPTTRLALALKRRRGGKPDMTAGFDHPRRRRGLGGVAGAGYSGLRLLAWLAEEWYRAFIAWTYGRRRYLVVYDRHFYYDYYASDVQARAGRSMSSRLHGYLLRRAYPRPELAVCLDAPAEILHARKAEQSLEVLKLRRAEYLSLAKLEQNMKVVDATRPLDAVVDEIAGLVLANSQ
jgi:thymidylate kinase